MNPVDKKKKKKVAGNSRGHDFFGRSTMWSVRKLPFVLFLESSFPNLVHAHPVPPQTLGVAME